MSESAKVATFGRSSDQTQTVWCPDCEKVAVIPAIPSDDERECDECGGLLEAFHPSMKYDRCDKCGDWHENEDEFCSEECRQSEKQECEDCGREHYRDYMREKDGDILCGRCHHGRVMLERHGGENQ